MAADCKSAGVSLQWFKSIPAHIKAGVAQLVEHQPSKLRVASSSLVSRSFIRERLNLAGEAGLCRCSSVVERFLGKEEVTGSIPVIGSTTTFNVPSLVQFFLYY